MILHENNPVWDVYDLYRTARLNKYYYAEKLNKTEWLNSIVELIIAISTPTSAIAGIWFLQSEYGQQFFKLCIAVATILSVVKPFLKLPKKIKDYDHCFSTYKSFEFDMEQIVIKISQDQKYSDQAKKLLNNAQVRKGKIISSSPNYKIDESLRKECEEKVIKELPNTHFFIPEID